MNGVGREKEPRRPFGKTPEHTRVVKPMGRGENRRDWQDSFLRRGIGASTKSPKGLHLFLIEHRIEFNSPLSEGVTERLRDEYHRKLQPLMHLTPYVFKSILQW